MDTKMNRAKLGLRPNGARQAKPRSRISFVHSFLIDAVVDAFYIIRDAIGFLLFMGVVVGGTLLTIDYLVKNYSRLIG